MNLTEELLGVKLRLSNDRIQEAPNRKKANIKFLTYELTMFPNIDT